MSRRRLPRAAAQPRPLDIPPPAGNRTPIGRPALLAALGNHRSDQHDGRAAPDCPTCTRYTAAIMRARADQTGQASP